MTARAWIRKTWARLWGAPEFDAPTMPMTLIDPPAPPARRRGDHGRWLDTIDTSPAELRRANGRPSPQREYWLTDSDLGDLSNLESRWAPKHQGSSPRERAEKR